MGTPTLSQYITDLTNACNYLDEQVAASSTETFFNGTNDVYKVQGLVDGIKYQLSLDVVSSSSEDLSSFNNSVSAAETYIASLP